MIVKTKDDRPFTYNRKIASIEVLVKQAQRAVA